MSQLRILVSHLLCQKPRSGSGEVSAFLNNLLGRHAMLVSTDVNAVAIQATRLVVDGERSDVVRGDLFSFFQPKPFFDVIVFNPPYVPTDDDEYQKSLVERDISASWAGGQNGREVTDRFLRTAMPYLRENGVVYLVVIELNDVDDTIAFATNLGYQCDIAGERAAGIEKLYVLRLQKNTTRL